MKIKSFYQWEVYEIAKELVLCQINILPRKMLYYHGQHTPYRTHRWMTIEDWTTFEDLIESTLSKSTSDGRTFENIEGHKEKLLKLTPTINVCLKKYSEAETPKFIAKEYATDSFKLVLQCTIEYVNTSCRQHKKEKRKDRSIDKSDSLKLKNTDEDTKKTSQRTCEKVDPMEVDENQNKVIETTKKFKNEKEIAVIDLDNIKGKERKSRKIQEATNTPEPKKLERSSSGGKASAKKRRLFDCSQEMNTLNTWLKKSAKQNVTENKETKSKKPAGRPKSRDAKWLESAEQLEKRVLLEKQQLQNNQEMADYLRGMMKAVPENYKYLSLMDLNKKKILNSLDQYKDTLDAVFQEHATDEVVCGNNGIDHYLVINLINNDIQLEMMNALAEAYKCENASLVANVLLPEWLIGLFMQNHKLSRAAAIEQLKLQEEFHMHSNEKGLEVELDSPVKRTRR